MERLILSGITHPGSLELDSGLFSLGRNPTNDFRVPDATVSSFHCELIVTAETLLVRDLNSTNGTFIQDTQIHEAILRPGQILRLGHAELKVQLEEEQESEEVAISIPELTREKEPEETHLLDGTIACINHPGVAAIVHCSKCEKSFCGDCVHSLSVAGGTSRLFCPQCSSRIEVLPNYDGDIKEKGKKRSLLSRLTQTIRIKFK